eukprot:TRINITY_DN458_c0_g1_i1.p1 TRINITY_DN458_c0_g1~~TRINITY_DN458_c0_g1_i1.p1  ORF type:complete len:562 (-),score=293.54 TRINITY_DN458_c0_g1_i1:117-1802(-)
MRLLIAPLALALATFGAAPAACANNAGFKVTVAESAIDYARTAVLFPMLEDMKTQIMAENLADRVPSSQQSFKLDKLGVEWIDARLTRIEIKELSFSKEHTRIDFLADSKLRVTLRDLRLRMTAVGRLNGDRLALSATIGDADLKMTVALGASQGYPTVRVTSASLDVDEDKLSITFTDGLGILRPLLNAISGWCNGLMADAAEKAFKGQYGKINDPLSEILRSIPLTHTITNADVPAVEFTKNIISRLSLHSAPTTTDKMLTLFFDVHAYLQGRTSCAASCVPRHTPNPTAPSHFLEISITDTLPCCIMTAASELNLLAFAGDIAKPELTLPAEYAEGLAPIIDAIFNRYAISYEASIEGVPKLTFSKARGISLSAVVKGTGYVSDGRAAEGAAEAEAAKTAAVEVTVEVTASARVAIVGNKITYSLANAALKLRDLKTLIPELSTTVRSELQDLIDVIISHEVLPRANEMLSKGYTLPVVQGLAFVRPGLAAEDGRIVVRTDFSYTKPSGPVVDELLMMLQRGEGPPETFGQVEAAALEAPHVEIRHEGGIVAGIAASE